jgi:hypothetical protein
MRVVTRLGAASLYLLLMASSARASEPGVHAELLNGAVRVTLEGSYAGSRYSVFRSDGPAQAARLMGERDALCTGDCYVMDEDALVGGTYWYRFDVTSGDGLLRQFGPVAVTIGGPAVGLKVAPSPNPLRDRGTLRVTAALAVGARAGNPGRATGLPGDVALVDMTGRVVRTLWSGILDRLTFDVPFSARDSRGQELPPGLYFVVVRAGTHRSISRVAVVR